MLSRSEVSKRNESERGEHISNKTIQSEADLLVPVLPRNSAAPCFREQKHEFPSPGLMC